MLAHRCHLNVGSGARRTAQELAGIQRPGEVLRHLPEDAGLAALLALLDLVPVLQDLAGGLSGDVAEDMRVAADQLLAAVLGHRGEVTLAALLEQDGEEDDLEQHVAELVEQLAVIAAVGGVGQLVGLLDRVRHDRALVLLAVPRALDTEAPADLVEERERASRLVRRTHGGATGSAVPEPAVAAAIPVAPRPVAPAEAARRPAGPAAG